MQDSSSSSSDDEDKVYSNPTPLKEISSSCQFLPLDIQVDYLENREGERPFYQMTSMFGVLEDTHIDSCFYKNRIYYFDSHSRSLLECGRVATLKDAFDTNEIRSLSEISDRTNQQENDEMDDDDDNWSDIDDEEITQSKSDEHILYEPYACKKFVPKNAEDVTRQVLLFKGITVDEKLGLVYLYGGADLFASPRLVKKDFLVLDLERNVWICVPELINTSSEYPMLPMEGHTMVKRKDKLYIFGGNTLDSIFVNHLYEIDMSEFDAYCLRLRNGSQSIEEDAPRPKATRIFAKNHDVVKTRSYHASEYISKYDVMVSVAGKVMKGANAPMLNEILIYHFKRNEFQIINDSSPELRNPFIGGKKGLPYAHVLHSTKVYGFNKFSTLDNCFQMAYYGGCKNTEYHCDASYDPHLYVLSFVPSETNPLDLCVLVTRVLITERKSTAYTNISFCPATQSFYFFGGFHTQLTDRLDIVTVNMSNISPVRNFSSMQKQLDRNWDICIKTIE